MQMKSIIQYTVKLQMFSTLWLTNFIIENGCIKFTDIDIHYYGRSRKSNRTYDILM